MAQQTLQTIISIGGRIDNTFGSLGTQLTLLGSQIDTISRKLIDFGKESLSTYVNYDDIMRDVKAAGGYTDAQMKELDKYNSLIAKTTVYSNVQAAEAETLMAHLGMTVEEIKMMMPGALRLAMAGNISVADSIDYLYSTLNATGHGFDYTNTFVDQLVRTANIGATDIDTLGESLERLGSGAQMFRGGTGEVLSILSEMSRFGADQRGSQGGTWIRNFALSLVAAESDLDTFAETWRALGLSEDEIAEGLDKRRQGLAATSIKALEAAGMKRYDAEGNLLPMIDIIKSLRDAVMGSDAWSEDLTELTGALNQAGDDFDLFTTKAQGLKDNQLYAILRQVFYKRGITTALNLISISDDEWDRAAGTIWNSEGYAQSVADVMQSGLGGAERGLDAAYTEFKTTVGDTLEPWATELIGFLDGVVADLDAIDPSGMQALTAALIPLAVAGPALVGAGTFFRLIGYALGPAGGIVVGAIALTGAIMALNSLRESNIQDSFGDMDMDMTSLGQYVTQLGSDFDASYQDVTQWTTALDKAVTSYQTASSTFAGSLLTDMLTKKELTPEDEDALLALGQEMGYQLYAGILSSASASMANIARLFGGEELAEGDENYQVLMGALETSKSEMLASAAEVSDGLRDALLSAFEDGKIDEDEYAKIKAWFEDYNRVLAQIARETQSEEDAIALQVLLHKGQAGSLEDAQEYGGKILSARDDALTTLEDDYLHDYYQAKIALDKQVASGAISQQKADAALAELEQKYQADVAIKSAPYTDAYQLLWDTVLSESDLGAAFETLNSLADRVLKGTITPEMADREFKTLYGNGTFWNPEERAQLAEVLGDIISAGGGDAYYAQNPDLQKYLTMEYLAKGWFGDYANQYLGTQAGNAAYTLPDTINRLITQNYTTEAARAAIEQLGLGDAWTNLKGYLANGMYDRAARQQILIPQETLEQVQYIVSTLGEVYDLEAVKSPELKARYPHGGAFSDLAAAYELMYGGASKNAQDFLLTQEPLTVPVEPNILVDPAMGEAQRKLDENPGTWHVTTQIDALGALAGAGPNKGAGASGKIVMSTAALNRYAEGGFADVPSIFGEAGGEWAIPEEHSDRTAELLNAAREGSGFTWPDLIDRTGGLNADAGHTPAQLVYSPTIIVKDARGVREALDEDKERLDKWFREKTFREGIETYS